MNECHKWRAGDHFLFKRPDLEVAGSSINKWYGEESMLRDYLRDAIFESKKRTGVTRPFHYLH